jgi:hypothetical protein
MRHVCRLRQQSLSLRDAKTVLLVYHCEAKIMECDGFLDNGVRPDNDIHATRRDLLIQGFACRTFYASRQEPDRHTEGLQ